MYLDKYNIEQNNTCPEKITQGKKIPTIYLEKYTSGKKYLPWKKHMRKKIATLTEHERKKIPTWKNKRKRKKYLP